MRWQDVYFDHSDDDPFPKMLEEEPENLLGPYVATEVGLVEKALQFAEVRPSDRVLDLGSGDGRLCVAAVQQFGAEAAVGIDIDEELVKLSQDRAEQCGVSGSARFLCADLTAPGVGATAVAMCGKPTLVIVFLLPEAEQKFQEVLMSLYDAGARVLSLAFELDRLQGLVLQRKEMPMYLYSKAPI